MTVLCAIEIGGPRQGGDIEQPEIVSFGGVFFSSMVMSLSLTRWARRMQETHSGGKYEDATSNKDKTEMGGGEEEEIEIDEEAGEWKSRERRS